MMISGIGYSSMPNTISQAKADGYSQSAIQQMTKTGQLSCETCDNRKYKDGSDEMVSFKAATHISPQSAPSAVRAHEQEHVSNAYQKAANKNGKVLQASVRIKNSICPECGRSYVSGGETTTQIKYNSDPYAKNSKSIDAANIVGQNLDLSA